MVSDARGATGRGNDTFASVTLNEGGSLISVGLSEFKLAHTCSTRWFTGVVHWNYQGFPMKKIAIGVYVLVTLALLAWGYYQAIYVAPNDAMQGEIYRIFYYHVPHRSGLLLLPSSLWRVRSGILPWRNRPEWAQIADALGACRR